MRSLRIMATGSRFMGVCRCPDTLPRPCGAGLRARFQIDSALRHLVHEHAALGKPIELIHGAAEGADSLVAEYWDVYRLGPVQAFPANWSVLGARAGNVRNAHMVGLMPDRVVAFPWVKRSRGTWDALRRARDAGIPTSVYRVTEICPALERTIDY